MIGKICILIMSILACSASQNSKYKYETKYFKVPLDHFNFQNHQEFQIKYLVNHDYWNEENGPIFFVIGKDKIERFAASTGFIWEIAEEFKAKIVFAEHRYYGFSLPFGNKSLDKDHLGYLTTAQALADYADFVDFLQNREMYPKYPVIAIGAFHGGITAAQLHMKYPHLVVGAIASSAPVKMNFGKTPCDAYSHTVTSIFSGESQNCAENIRRSWSVLRNFTTSADKKALLQTKLNLCEPVETAADLEDLLNFFTVMYEALALSNYPFQWSFMPAYPVRAVCQHLNESSLNDIRLLENLKKVLDTTLYYNSTPECSSYKNTRDSFINNAPSTPLRYEACTESFMPKCENVSDMFEAKPWDFSAYSEGCRTKFGVTPRPGAARVLYGAGMMKHPANIVFNNGLLDPWSEVGILYGFGVVETITIPEPEASRFHALMASHPDDPASVVNARSFHKKHMHRWIGEFQARQFQAYS